MQTLQVIKGQRQKMFQAHKYIRYKSATIPTYAKFSLKYVIREGKATYIERRSR